MQPREIFHRGIRWRTGRGQYATAHRAIAQTHTRTTTARGPSLLTAGQRGGLSDGEAPFRSATQRVDTELSRPVVLPQRRVAADPALPGDADGVSAERARSTGPRGLLANVTASAQSVISDVSTTTEGARRVPGAGAAESALVGRASVAAQAKWRGAPRQSPLSRRPTPAPDVPGARSRRAPVA